MSRTILRRSRVVAVKRDAFGQGAQWFLMPDGTIRRYSMTSAKAKRMADEDAQKAIEEAAREDTE